MDFAAHKPIYLQIVDYLCEKILRNELAVGARVPSVRDLANEVEVTPNTATRAFSALQDQGLIEQKRGVGAFVADDAKAKILALKKQQFIDEELPGVFHTMQLVEMDLAELETHYRAYTDQPTAVESQ